MYAACSNVLPVGVIGNFTIEVSHEYMNDHSSVLYVVVLKGVCVETACMAASVNIRHLCR